jgi:hypothetical protein
MNPANSPEHNRIHPLHFAVGCIVLTVGAYFSVLAACTLCVP